MSPNSEMRQARSSKCAGPHLDGVAAHAERAAVKFDVVAPVVQRDEVGDQLALVDLSPRFSR